MTMPARRTLALPRGLTPALPLVFGLGILIWAGLWAHTYRLSMQEKMGVSPAFPRASVPFRLDLPGPPAGTLREVTIQIEKERFSPYAPGLWPIHRPVLQMPLILESKRNRVTIGLGDPGIYRVRVKDRKSGNILYSRQLRVIVPSSVLRNELILMALLGVSGTLSGQVARRIAQKRLWKGLNPPLRALSFWLMIELSVILLFWSMTRPPGPEEAPKIRIPQAISISHESSSPAGILTIRHRFLEPGITGWERFGEERTVFQGRIDRKTLARNGFFLSPGGGDETFSLLTAGGSRGFDLRKETRAIPLGSPFPLDLFSGLILFSGAFFLRNI